MNNYSLIQQKSNIIIRNIKIVVMIDVHRFLKSIGRLSQGVAGSNWKRETSSSHHWKPMLSSDML